MKIGKPSLPSQVCYRIGSTLKLRISEEQCKTNSISYPCQCYKSSLSTNNVTSYLMRTDQQIAIIIGDGNCFLEQFLQSCLERRDTMNVSMPFLWNMSRLTANTSNNTCHMDLVPSWNTVTTCKSLECLLIYSGNSCTIYIFANSCLHLQ